MNEHILGGHWPAAAVRLEMLEESIDVMRTLWRGGMRSHYGKHYVVQNARVYSLPDEPPPIYVAAGQPRALELAGRIGDGLIALAPKAEVIRTFESSGGKRKPRYGQLTVAWAREEAEARRTAFQWWPNAGIQGELTQELPLPRHFEQASKMVREEDLAKEIVCGPDARRHVEKIQEFFDAGYDHVYVHQIGPDQEGFFEFYEKRVLPEFR